MHESDRYAGLRFQQQGEQAAFLRLPGGRFGKGGGIQVEERLLLFRLPCQTAQGVFPSQAKEGGFPDECAVGSGGRAVQPLQFFLQAEALVRPFGQRMPVL